MKIDELAHARWRYMYSNAPVILSGLLAARTDDAVVKALEYAQFLYDELQKREPQE